MFTFSFFRSDNTYVRLTFSLYNGLAEEDMFYFHFSLEYISDLVVLLLCLFCLLQKVLC